MKNAERVMQCVLVALVIVLPVVTLLVGLVPWCRSKDPIGTGLLYGPLYFAVLLEASIILLMYAALISDKKPVDYRVVHFTLVSALVFGIGAVVIAILLVATALGLMPSLRP